MARAEAEDIIAAATIKAHEEARLIHELAYDQGLALAERDHASKQEQAADRQRAKDAVLRRVGDTRLRAASIESAGRAPINIKPAHRLENVEYLMSAGCSVEDALARSGYRSLGSFEKAAYRHGRNDLIRYAKERLAS